MINNVLILRNEKILLMFNRKTASLSISSFVINTLGYNKPDSDIYLLNKSLNDFSDYKKIAIVRDPFKRILSGYNDNLSYGIINNRIMRNNKTNSNISTKLNSVERDLTFEEFVNNICLIPDEKSDPHFRSQTYNFNEFKPDVIIKIEDMIGWSDLGLPNIPHIHKSKNYIITEIPEDLKLKIKERFKNDFEILGYN
jgi:hypothetical protein